MSAVSPGSLAARRAIRSELRDPSPDAQRRPSRTVPEPVRTPLEVVPDKYRSPARRRLQRRIVTLVGICIVLSTPFALVLVHVQLTANQLRLTRLQTQADQADVRYQKLRLEVAQLSSPGRVVATAQQLGMVTPTTITYLTATPGPAAPAPVTGADTNGSGAQGWAIAKRINAGR